MGGVENGISRGSEVIDLPSKSVHRHAPLSLSIPHSLAPSTSTTLAVDASSHVPSSLEPLLLAPLIDWNPVVSPFWPCKL